MKRLKGARNESRLGVRGGRLSGLLGWDGHLKICGQGSSHRSSQASPAGFEILSEVGALPKPRCRIEGGWHQRNVNVEGDAPETETDLAVAPIPNVVAIS